VTEYAHDTYDRLVAEPEPAQSILKWAFEGRLTEQWRKDHSELISGENSAARLLEGIKAEKAKLEAERIAKRNAKRKAKPLRTRRTRRKTGKPD